MRATRMARPARISPSRKTPPPGGALPALPPGTPAWVTPELVADTLDCWRPHYAKALTAADAVEILTTVGRLLDACRAGDDTATAE
jgi:hypothetical protein